MCPKLTLKQRLSGFLGLTAFGYLLTILATLTISEGYDKEVPSHSTYVLLSTLMI